MSETLPVWPNFDLKHTKVLKIDSEQPKVVSMKDYFVKKNFWYNDLFNENYNKCFIFALNNSNESKSIQLFYHFLIYLILFF
jgi:hypothetical protein